MAHYSALLLAPDARNGYRQGVAEELKSKARVAGRVSQGITADYLRA